MSLQTENGICHFAQTQLFCQDFSWLLGCPKKFDRIFRGEIFKISPLNLQDLSPKFAVKLQAIYNLLKFNRLQNYRKIGNFVKIFYQFISMQLPAIFEVKSEE